MKKRILSMLLLVTLLVTGIPVMAVSAEETPVYTNEDYAELYAKQNNLVHLYMAFDNGDAAEYYDLSAREWYDLVGGGMGEIDAMLKHDTTANWTVGANGGFTISMPDKTRSATNKITFGTGAAGTAADALKDASGKFFTKYTVESAIKIVNRQIDFRYDTFDAAALAAKAVTASGVITYTVEGLGKVTSAQSLINATTLTFTRSGDTSAAKSCTITYNNNGAATTTVSVSFKAGAATASVDVSMVQSETATIKVNEADGVTLTGLKRVNGDIDIGAQVQNGYAFGNMFVLRWMNMKGYNPLSNGWSNGRGLTRFCAGENYNATYVPPDTNFAVVGKLVDPCMVLNDSSAVSLSLVKTVNAAGDKDVWSVYSGSLTVGENVEALGLTGAETYGGKASSPDLFLMNKEQGTIYAVRIYNEALTKAEVNWNHFVDILAYNGYDISGIASLSAAKKEAIASYYAGISIEEADLSRLEEAQAVVDEDYDALYIRTAASGAQLIGLFTAFRGEIETVTADVANNKWTNKVGADSTDDIFLKQNNNQHWHVSANGGLWANGICVSSWNRIGDFRMELPDDWAALPSFTVEGAQILNGVESEKNPFPSGVYHMRIDLLRFHHSAAVRHSDPLHGGGTWHGNTSNAWHDGGRDNTWRKMYDTNGKEGAGETMWVSKTTAADGAVTYAYGHSYAGGQTLQAIAGATYSAEAYDASDSARDFYMYASMAVEVYAIRVYNGVLSASEKQYNHLIDLLGFYQVSIPEEITTQHLATLASAYANTTMVLDDNGSGDDYYEIHDALTNDLQEIVDLMHPAEKTEYDELYAAQDHLLALYTAFDKDASVLLEKSLWKNKVEGAHATIVNNNASIKITAGENGGLTIGGTHTKDTYNGNTAPTVGIKLSDSYLDLNAFTVESASILRGVAYTTVSGGETVADTLDNAGNWQNFRFGALSCDYWINLNGKVRLHMNWRNVVIGAGQAYHNGVRETTLRQAYDAAGNVYAGKTQTVTMTKNDDGGRDYAVYYGSAKVTLQDKNNPLGQPTITKDQYDAVLKEAPKLGWFYLFAGTPGDVYAIRVYDKVLNDDERLHNHLVDLLAFYEIDLPSNVAALDLSALAEKHGATSFFDEGEAIKAELQKDLDFASFTVNVGVETKVVVKDDASYAAVRFMASIDKAIADKYEIKSYGILIAPKAYVDAADAFTAEALEAYLASEGVENNGSAESRAYLNVVADGFYAETDETYTIAGGFANFSLKTKENNPAFAAVAYAVVEIEGEDVVVYGSYNEDACITVKETLAAAREAIYLENAADPRLSVYDEVLAQFN